MFYVLRSTMDLLRTLPQGDLPVQLDPFTRGRQRRKPSRLDSAQQAAASAAQANAFAANAAALRHGDYLNPFG